MLALPLLGLVSWLVPERFWRPTRTALMHFQRRLGLKMRQRNRAAKRIAMIESAIGRPLTANESAEVDYRTSSGGFDDRLRIFRSYHPLGWNPDVTLIGAERLDAALERGRGAVLWVAVFSSARLITKIALHRAGYAVHHLSRPGHGFSNTELSTQYLNPFWVRIEDRYLAERIRITDAETLRAVKTIRQRLLANQIVSITDLHEATRTVRAPFLAGYRHFTTGPPHFALSTGAALFPVFTIDTGYRSFEVVIAEPVYPAPDATIESIIGAYSTALGEMAERHPHLWLYWPIVELPEGATRQN